MNARFAGLVIAVLCLVPSVPALAHSFNVALVIPLSGPSKTAGQQFADGFMLATQERDNHPDNHADGHLGGLDVYVHRTDSEANDFGKLRSILRDQSIDFVVPIGSGKNIGAALAAMAGDGAIVLRPGRLPQNRVRFTNAFKAVYGYAPTELSAQGYNEARRIDAAVRPLDSTGDKADLRKRLVQTAITFSW